MSDIVSEIQANRSRQKVNTLGYTTFTIGCSPEWLEEVTRFCAEVPIPRSKFVRLAINRIMSQYKASLEAR